MSTTRIDRTGLAYAMAANLAWGGFPIYFKAIDGVDVLVALGHRMTWAPAFLLLVAVVIGALPAVVEALRSRRTLGFLLLSTALVGGSWVLYIWAVFHDRIVEAAMGYYLTPLLNVLTGMLLFGERLSRVQWVAVGLAGCGVAVLIAVQGQIPWIGLSLGVAFAIYSGVRKLVAVESIPGLLIESSLIAPFGIAILAYVGIEHSVLAFDAPTTALLVFSGVFTTVPIIWYVAAARRMSLTTLGNITYIAPSLTFLIGVLVYREPFTWTHGVTFALIWTGLTVYALESRITVRVPARFDPGLALPVASIVCGIALVAGAVVLAVSRSQGIPG